MSLRFFDPPKEDSRQVLVREGRFDLNLFAGLAPPTSWEQAVNLTLDLPTNRGRAMIPGRPDF